MHEIMMDGGLEFANDLDDGVTEGAGFKRLA
jgi:hypothetical protein